MYVLDATVNQTASSEFLDNKILIKYYEFVLIKAILFFRIEYKQMNIPEK